MVGRYVRHGGVLLWPVTLLLLAAVHATQAQNDINWHSWKSYIDEMIASAPNRIVPGGTQQQQDAAARPPPPPPRPVDVNAQFRQCCVRRELPDSCLPRCNYDQVTPQLIQRMVFGQDQCPRNSMLAILQCAGDMRDHTDCCRAEQVDRTLAGPRCLQFCNVSPGAPGVGIDLGLAPCLGQINKIKSCFAESARAQG